MRTAPMVWGKEQGFDNPCACCGKQLKDGKPRFYVRVINGGSDVVHPDDEHMIPVDDPADMGMHFLGAECRKKFPKDFVRKE